MAIAVIVSHFDPAHRAYLSRTRSNVARFSSDRTSDRPADQNLTAKTGMRGRDGMVKGQNVSIATLRADSYVYRSVASAGKEWVYSCAARSQLDQRLLCGAPRDGHLLGGN